MRRRGAVPICIWGIIIFLVIGFIIRVVATVIDVSSAVSGIYAFTIALGYACLWLILDFILFPLPCIFFRFIIPKKRMLGWQSYVLVVFHLIVAVVTKLFVQKYFYFDDIWLMEYSEFLWIKINVSIIQFIGGRTLYSSWYGMGYDELTKHKISAETVIKCVDTNEAFIAMTIGTISEKDYSGLLEAAKIAEIELKRMNEELELLEKHREWMKEDWERQ